VLPVSADFPAPFSEVLVQLRDVLGLLRDHVVATSALGPVLAQAGQPDVLPPTDLATAPASSQDAMGGPADPAVGLVSPEAGFAGPQAIAASLRSCMQSLESCGRTPLALLVQGCEKALPSLQPGHPRHSAEASQVIEQALLTVLRQAQSPVVDDLALVSELFQPYAAVQTLAGVDRAHPADLWPGRHPLLGLSSDPFAVPRALDSEARLALEEALLKTLKQPGPEAFRAMSDLCAALGEGETPKGFAIDPTLFSRFHVSAVPVYVVLAEPLATCETEDCLQDPLPAHDRLSGNIPLETALNLVAAGQGDAASTAAALLTEAAQDEATVVGAAP
jgi:type-F conjugative transfer system pilin assembly protein TrbC